MKQYFLPRLRDVLFFSIFLAVLLLGPQMLNYDGDLPRHLLMGKIVLETQTIPTKDIFSHVYQGRQLIPHEWLAGTIFYIFYYFFDLNGVVILSALLLSITFTLVYEYVVVRSAVRLPALFLVVWGGAISSLHWIARPHLFTMLFLAIYFILVDRLNNDEDKKLWPFPVLMLLWANLHAEFIVGFLILGAYMAGWVLDLVFSQVKPSLARGKRLFAATVLSFLATLVNPVGWRTWETVFGYVNNRYLMSRIHETRPPDFSAPEFLILLAFMGFSFFLLSVKENKLSTGPAVALAGFSMMVLIAARNVHIYGVIAPLLLAGSVKVRMDMAIWGPLEKVFASVERGIRGYVWIIFCVLFLTMYSLTGMLRINYQFDPARFPVQAIDWLEQNYQQGKMFNAFDWGGYILLEMWPEHLTFIDSQTDVSGEVTREYEKVIKLEEGWQEVFRMHDIRWVIVPGDWPLVDALMSDGWHQVYQDDVAIILLHPLSLDKLSH